MDVKSVSEVVGSFDPAVGIIDGEEGAVRPVFD